MQKSYVRYARSAIHIFTAQESRAKSEFRIGVNGSAQPNPPFLRKRKNAIRNWQWAPSDCSGRDNGSRRSLCADDPRHAESGVSFMLPISHSHPRVPIARTEEKEEENAAYVSAAIKRERREYRLVDGHPARRRLRSD